VTRASTAGIGAGAASGAWVTALLAALLLTAANAAKPLVIDDPIYVAYAQQIAKHPGDPYGFEAYWDELPEPAMNVGTVPCVLPYWLAGAITLFGDHPVAWKLSLFPFALALTASLAFLLGRFAKPLATPVLFALALGPTVLPGFNLMLDVPALALGLLGYALFVLAGERRSARLALAAGLALGLGLQTKYSAVVYPALVLVHAALYQRPREGALALLAAAGLFFGWEALLVARYGQSHVLAGVERVRTLELLPGVALAEAEAPGTTPIYWLFCLLSLGGGTLVFPALIALVGLGTGRWLVAGAALAAGAAFVAILLLPEPPAFAARSFFAQLAARNPELMLFVPLGTGAAAGLGAVARRALRGGGASEPRADRVLAAWLLLELAGYFFISPYPAVRRLIGFGIAAALLAARAAAGRAQDRSARDGVSIATAFGLAIGVLYFAAELADASVRRALTPRVVERLAQLGADPGRETIWYVGHWELQYYAERAGFRPVVAERSRLQPGDWLLLCDGTAQPPIRFPADHFRREAELPATSPWPWSTQPAYYDGVVPLRRQPRTQAVMRIYRVTRELVPRLEPWSRTHQAAQ
jgi:4-amino-4-deoxy-L-arabinose transferase-like glycosyltransferase